GLDSAEQVWEEYTYPIFQWVRERNGIAGFAHMQYLDDGIPQSLTCCTPIEYPVETALGMSDFISEDVQGGESAIRAYYRLLNTGFRPGLAAGTDYPCNGSAPLGSLLTYVRVAPQPWSYRGWIEGIAAGRTVISRTGHNEFLDLVVNSTAQPGDEVELPAGGPITVTVTWTAKSSVSGTLELVHNGVVVASKQGTAANGAPVTLTAMVDFSKSGWLAARRMGGGQHRVHTGAVIVIVNDRPVRLSRSDAEFYVQWMDTLLARTAAGGAWASYFPTDRSAARARYSAAKAVFQQIASESTPPPTPPPTDGQTIFTTEIPTLYEVGGPYELGTRFWSESAGRITAVRIYANPAEGGAHTVRIWRVQDSALVAGPYSWNITPGTEGWKTFTLPTPVPIAANTNYIVAVSNGPDGNYAEVVRGFDTAIVNLPLHANVGAGVYTESMGTMPTATWENTMYFRDVIFVPEP
ncbi:MAG: CehA/McbA family metallohydrolase, partial [Vicinamibacteraceae bacterium]